MSIGLFTMVNAGSTYTETQTRNRRSYLSGEISKEEYMILEQKALEIQAEMQNWGLFAYFGGIFGTVIVCLLFALVQWVKFKDFKAIQAGKDIYEMIMKGYKNGNKYQIETPRDSCKTINAVAVFVEIVRQTQTFISLVERIKSGGGDIVFDHANILKEVLVIFEKTKDSLPKPAKDDDDDDENGNKDPIDPHLDENIMNLMKPERKEAREFLLKLGIYRELIDPNWHLMFRPIDRVLCLDANDDSLDNIKGMYYLMPGANEKDFFNFPIRLSNDEHQIPIGKCYATFRYIKHILGKEFLFLIYDDNSDETEINLRIHGSKIDQAEIEALGQFAYLVYKQQASNEKDLNLKETEIAKYKSDGQNRFADALEDFIDKKGTGGLAEKIEHRIQNKPVQMSFGLVLLMAVMFALGFFVCKTWFVPTG